MADPTGAGSSNLPDRVLLCFPSRQDGESGKSKGGGVCFMTNSKWCNAKDIKTFSLLLAEPGASDDDL